MRASRIPDGGVMSPARNVTRRFVRFIPLKVQRKLRARNPYVEKLASRLKILKRREPAIQRGTLRRRGESSEKRLLVTAGDRKPVVKSVYSRVTITRGTDTKLRVNRPLGAALASRAISQLAAD